MQDIILYVCRVGELYRMTRHYTFRLITAEKLFVTVALYKFIHLTREKTIIFINHPLLKKENDHRRQLSKKINRSENMRQNPHLLWTELTQQIWLPFENQHGYVKMFVYKIRYWFFYFFFRLLVISCVAFLSPASQFFSFALFPTHQLFPLEIALLSDPHLIRQETILPSDHDNSWFVNVLSFY